MAKYKLRITAVSDDYESTADIPENAAFIDVEYEEPTGMDKPSHKAVIKYLERIEDNEQD